MQRWFWKQERCYGMGLFIDNVSNRISGNYSALIYSKTDWLIQGSFNNAASSGEFNRRMR
jgi:hypothetical protein